MKKTTADLLLAMSILVLLIVLGAWYFYNHEGWSKVDSFYFTVMTITTVGYGDLVPTHEASKIVTSIYSLISIPLVIFILGGVVKAYFEERISKIEKMLLHQNTDELAEVRTANQEMKE